MIAIVAAYLQLPLEPNAVESAERSSKGESGGVSRWCGQGRRE
jgi:hypothetical protein